MKLRNDKIVWKYKVVTVRDFMKIYIDLKHKVQTIKEEIQTEDLVRKKIEADNIRIKEEIKLLVFGFNLFNKRVSEKTKKESMAVYGD